MSREKVYKFGTAGNLVGVMTEPLDTTLAKSKPAVLFSNVGVSHRVGPFRLNVELARRLAAQGFYSLRFDFSGLGDSEASRDGRSDTERAIAEAKSAMDLLTKRTGIDRFVMIGLCSGADKTHIVTNVDHRIIGAVFIDGYAHKTPRFYLIRLTLRFLQWKRFKVFVRARLAAIKAKLARAGAAPEAYRAVIASPDRRRTEGELLAMVARGVKQLHLFTVSTDYTYNYQGQFWDMYPKLPRGTATVITERYPEVDHTLSVVQMQRLFIERICRWMAQF